MFKRLATNGYDCENFEQKRDAAIDYIEGLLKEKAIVFPDISPNYACIKRDKIADDKYGEGANKYAFFDVIPGYVIKINRRFEDFIPIVREAYIYNKAVEKGLNQYFARTYYMGTIDNIAITIQEYVEVDSEFNDDISYDRFSRFINEEDLKVEYEEYRIENEKRGRYVESFEDFRYEAIDEIKCDQENIIEAFIEDNWLAVNNFLNDYKVDDIHYANFGFRDSSDLDTFVIIDFSGFHDDYWEDYVKDFSNEEYAEDLERIYCEDKE